MRAPAFTLLLLTSLLLSAVWETPARAQSADQVPAAETYDRRPRSGLGAIIVGWGAVAFAGGQLATLPVCFASWYPWDETSCVVSASALAGGAAILAAVVLPLGYQRWREYKAWRARQRADRPWRGLRLSVAPHRLGLGYHARF